MTAADETNAAASLYFGQTFHARISPFAHRFRYRIASLLIDIDRLDEAARMSPLFSVGKFNLFSFHPRDHGDRDGSSLRDWAERLFHQSGIQAGNMKLTLMSFPRVLGYVFNPISVWFSHDEAGKLRGVIYEVNNTFGDTHAYVVPMENTDTLHAAEKKLHVSPFYSRDGRYRFRLSPPGEDYRLAIVYERDGRPALTAIQTGVRTALTSASLLRLFFSLPLMTLKVIAAIHFEALRLVIKGARYHKRPQPKEASSRGEPSSTSAIKVSS